MKKVVRREDVDFNSCKTKDGSTLEFDLTVHDSNGSEPIEFPFKSEFPVPPSPDLTDRLKKLKPRLMESFGYSSFDRLLEDAKFKANGVQKRILEARIKEIEADIRVTGVAYLGKNNTGATIKGTFDGSPINTKIYFENPDYGEEMEGLVEEIADEVYEYVYNNKKLQLEAFDDEG